MNTSTLFKKAHKLTKEVIKAGDDYRVTFGACLKFLRTQKISITDKLIEMGLKVWENYGKKRIYMTVAQFNEINNSNFMLNDRKNKIFFDFETNAIMRSYNNKKPVVEVQF